MRRRLWATTWIGMRNPDIPTASTSQASPLTKLVIAHLGPIGLAIAVTDNADAMEELA